MMDREGLYRVFGDKSLSYVFNRLVIDTESGKARDTVKVRGSLLEEELGLSNMDGLMLEMLLGDQFVEFYQNLLNLPYDRRSPEDKLYDFSVALYKWISGRVGYIPDWILPDRENHLKTFIELVLTRADDYIPDSEVLLGLLLKNTDFTKNGMFKEQLRKGVWSATVTGMSSLSVAEDEYLLGVTNTEVDSLSLYVRIAERGYRDVGTLNKYLNHQSFKETVVTDYTTVCKAINDFLWKYGRGEIWSGFTEKVYRYVSKVGLDTLSVDRPNPNQLVFQDSEELDNSTVQITFSDKVVVTVRQGGLVLVLYNKEFYTASFHGLVTSLDRELFRAKRIIPVIGVLLTNLPLDIPRKEREIKKI